MAAALLGAVVVLVVARARAETRAAWADAARAFERATQAPPGAERTELFRAAAAQYRALLLADPRRDEAAEAALAGSHAFRQVGDWDEAVAMLRPLVDEYGAESILARLEKGDPKSTPPAAPDPRRYAERVKHVTSAYRQLASALLLSFDYARALPIFDAWARRARLDPASRREAAHNAVVLHAAMGDRAGAVAANAVFAALAPAPRELLELEMVVVEIDAAQWDERVHGAPDAERARRSALRGLAKLYDAARGRRVGIDLAARAAARAAGLSLDHGDAPAAATWCERAASALAASRVAAPASVDPKSAGEPPGAPAWMTPCEARAGRPPRGRHVAPPVEAVLLPWPRVTE